MNKKMECELSGRFITFEGVDGCGKTTQRKLTATWLRERGRAVVETFEPGASALGVEIRRLLLSGEHVPAPEAELMLFLADRVQHVREVIRPALEAGTMVLCDRYTDSTRAYQLAGRELDTGVLNTMLKFAELGCRPDVTLWFDLPVSMALSRMRGRVAAGETSTRMDDERWPFHAAVKKGFSSIFEAEPERVCRVDASGGVEEVQKCVRKILGDIIA